MKIKRIAIAVFDNLIGIVSLAVLTWMVLTMTGCAGTSSEITPAESAAAQKSYRLTGESAKRNTSRIVIRKVGAEADSSEEK